MRRGDVELRGEARGESGEVVLFLHGLAGYGREWSAVVDSCCFDRRVVLLDQRGHGSSSRRPQDISREAFVADVVAVARAVSGADPVWLVGQSLGGHTAFLTASLEPELIAGIVVVEATPKRPDAGRRPRIERWLDSWPRPFPTRAAAVEFFKGRGGEAWADGLELCADGLRPRFDDDVMLAALDELADGGWWEEWSRLRCPTLVVRGDRGWITDDEADRMAAMPNVTLTTIDDAGHDVHLDNPESLATAIEAFLDHGRDQRVSPSLRREETPE